MKFVPVKVSRFVATSALKGQHASPSLLFAAGVVGMVGTAVLASRATLKVEEVLDRHASNSSLIDEAIALGRVEYTELEIKKDKSIVYTRTIVDIAKLYAPAVGLGIASIAALTGSHRILTRRNVALTAAYAGLDKALIEYRDRVRESVGEELERDIYHGVQKREIVEETSKGVKVTEAKVKTKGSPYARVFDEYNPNFQNVPEYNGIFLRAQQQYANDRLRAKGYIFLSDIYVALGFEETAASRVVGWLWNGNGDQYVDFGLGDWPSAGDYIHGQEGGILLDFNVDGTIFDKLRKS